MQIEVIKVDIQNKGKYKNAVVSYKQDGKVQSRNIVSFGDYKHVYDKLAESTQGDLFDIKLEKVVGKDNIERWQWTNAEVTGKAGVGAVAKTPGVSATPRSSYETPEERAKKQVYIVRQSSISNAIAYLTARPVQKGEVVWNVNNVLEVAQEFEDYVFDTAGTSELPDFNVEVQ